MVKEENSDKKLSKSMIALIIFLIVLGLTSSALAYSLARVENNIFNFGHIIIDIGYYDEHGNSHVSKENSPIFHFEQSDYNTLNPGELISKDIFVENKGNLPTYYRLYVIINSDEVGLADKISVRIKNSNGDALELIKDGYEIKMSEFSKDHAIALGLLEPEGADKRANLKLEIIYPENIPATKRGKMNFDLIAEGVQARNNADKGYD